jgi:hypothetical protein
MRAPSGYQLLGRALDRRGPATEPVIAKLREVLVGPQAAGRYQSRSAAGRNLGRAFSRYGGFESRAEHFKPNDIRSVLARRYELIQASASNAPIRRVTWRAGGDVSPVAIRFGAAGSAFSYEQDPDQPSLRGEIRSAAEDSHKRVRKDAWEKFLAGNYREAAGAFSAAMTLDSADVEARMGELFSHLSNGNIRTAAAATAELARRFDNPFIPTMDMPSRYGNQSDVIRLRTSARLVAHAEEAGPSVAAAYILALWYLGEEDDALQAADRLGRLHKQSVFGEWGNVLRALDSPSTERGAGS